MADYMQLFTDDEIDHTESTKELNGGKGHNLIMMKHAGYPVPNGMVITTEACNKYRGMDSKGAKKLFIIKLVKHVMKYMKTVIAGSKTQMVSVRSGAAVSMPGMMDTVLNVGVEYLHSGKTPKKFQKDCLMRFTDMFLDVVIGVDRESYKDDLEENVYELFDLIRKAYPTYEEMLGACIKAVFDSWDNERAVHYRNMHGIDHNMGTAIVIQSMVFGNLNAKSGSGVMFTRNPNTGVSNFMGEFLINAQGEDVVAGTATPRPLYEVLEWDKSSSNELEHIAACLEKDNRDMQDIEFTVEDGKLFILQTRSGKRSPKAEVRIALDMVKEGLVVPFELKINKGTIGKLREPTLPIDFNHPIAATGIASGGFLATGKVCTTVEEVLACKGPAIMVAEETTPDDIKGMDRAVGILTRTGGATSHAAVVARAMNKPCVVGCKDLDITDAGNMNEYILIDGQTGNVYWGETPFEVDTEGEYPVELFNELLSWCDTEDYTIEFDSFYEIQGMSDNVYKVALSIEEINKFEVDTALEYLADTFDMTIIHLDNGSDSIAELIGDPSVDDINIIDIIEAGSKYENIMFLSGGSIALPRFTSMTEVLDSGFYGVVSDQFISDVMGSEETYNTVSEQVGMKSRVINLTDLVSLMELQLDIG